MKNLTLMTWITQLGLSVALPPLGFILLAMWLRKSLGWGSWILWVGIILGIYCAIQGLMASLRTMDRLAKPKSGEEKPVSFNDHT